jgi:hypothetical protein
MEQRARSARGWVTTTRRFVEGLVFVVGVIIVRGVAGVLVAVRPLIPGLPPPRPSYPTAPAWRGDVTVSVTATAPVAAAEAVPLSFGA